MLRVVALACVRGEHPLFNDLSFDLGVGELLWVEGENGSGKTSLLRILAGLAPAEAGEVSWRGAPARTLGEDFARELLFLGHANGLKDDLTVTENLRYAARLGGIPATAAAIGAAVSAVGLAHRAHLAVRHLSQGQRRRAALARLWLDGARALWILDEPFAALDADSIERLAARIGAHLDQGGAAVLTSHQEVAVAACRIQHLRLAN